MRKLTTHVLDTMHGKPAANLRICLLNEVDDLLKDVLTNIDGRLDQPLLQGNAMIAGTYRIVFHVGDYYKGMLIKSTKPLFLNKIPVEFGIDMDHDHYHVPLLVSPYGYSTYRGS